ncbi:inhibitor of nuclear factor kappa-B kinase subunit alpha-like isoform X2 [Coccinella septempunctata]|uniref:inhibitor of nuclear factor kappa-B kinase subunit alpha-like isoform X2 n=1 Tax=Coccinella septempunctata TaxID=41139 RepID=UPI001D05E18E|nr:inhibitor of nuclear factor kappa-B kinase subunit alpha-like isoform X2 [Coccinella septempunctata]
MGSTGEIEPSVIGDWIRISVLGSGGFGTVSLWRCGKTNDSIAVKKCKLQCATSLTQKHKERWCNEVQKMKELDHPNVVKYKPLPLLLETELNKFNPTKLPLLPMEYCQRGNLRHLLAQPLNMCGLEESTVKDVLLDISGAVHYLHSNKITHRDIKPENIVLQDCPTRCSGVIYKLIDLGYAKELNNSTVSFVGTLLYLAPEIYANKNYDCSVDYWSLGILTFEVICGVLPFVPRFSPIERYQLMKDKTPDQICVFINYMGNVQYSPELFEENKLSSCLKGHMEIWLRKALQFNPKLRHEPFPNSNNLFEQLNSVLTKKILKVFVVYKYKFYSYEFDECTRLSTVREWIARDTEISVDEQLLLGSFQFNDCDDQTLIANCFIDETYELFLFKRNALFNIEKFHLPRLVKLMFEKARDLYTWHEVKSIYSHSIYYIQQDILFASAFNKAMVLYLKQLAILLNKIHKNWELCRQNILRLTGKVKKFNKEIKRKNLICSDLILADKFIKLYNSIEKCLCDEYLLAVNIENWVLKLDAMKTINLQDDLIKLPQMKEFLGKAASCLQRTAKNSANSKDKLGCGEMLTIVCRVMKFKDSLFHNKNLQDYSRYLGKATDYLQSLLCWLDSFESHIQSLHEIFDSILAEASTAYKTIGSDSQKNCAIGSNWVVDNAVQQSQILSSRFAELVCESISNYESIRGDIESYIEDISSLL